MFIYTYTALNSDGILIKDTLIAKNKKQAFLYLVESSQSPITIKLNSIFVLNKENLNYRIHFFHQLSILMTSGINLLQCLNILKNNCKLPFWKNIISCAVNDLEKGENLSNYLKKHPNIFSKTVISLIIVAEKTGRYDENFKVITKMLEQSSKMNRIIIKSIRYPIALLIFSFILLFIMILYVIPQFENIYASFQHELPLLTKLIISFSTTVRENINTLITTLAIIFTVFIRFRPQLRYYSYLVIALFPYINKLVQLHNLTLFFLTLSSTLKAGLPLTDCLKCTIETTNNTLYRDTNHNIYNAVIKGESLSASMENTTQFPNLAIQLITIAEESGRLDYFTLYLSKYYSEKYISVTEQRFKSLEPILLVLIATIIGIIMLAMYLPIFNLGNVITGL